MRFTQGDKYEIIRLVESSELGIPRTLQELRINKSTFYKGYMRYRQFGYDGLAPIQPKRKVFWHQIPPQERQQVVELVLEYPDKSPIELAHFSVDHKGGYISESSVYRILKTHGLVTSPTHILMEAADEFIDKTSRPNQMWQNDFTYLKVIDWGWYYMTSLLDDYSRYIIDWELCDNMKAQETMNIMDRALVLTGLGKNHRTRILSDNGSSFISKDLREYLDGKDILHIRGKPNHL